MILRIGRSAVVRTAGKRLLEGIPVIWGVTFITFTLMNLLPGGAALAIAGGGASPAELHDLSVRLHLNEPFFVRYWDWLTGAVTGHLGDSLNGGQPVSAILAQRLPVTVELVLLSMVLSLVFAIPVGVLAARKPSGIIDRTSMAVSMFGVSVPSFVFGVLMALIFGVKLRLLPAQGFVPLSAGVWRNIQTMVLPSCTLGFGLFCRYVRILRADILDQLIGEDYIITARAKGLPSWMILFRHAFRNSLFSLLTVVGLNLGTLIGGTVLIEEIFSLPGMGQALIQAIQIQDVITVEAIVVCLALAVVVTNLITDLLYAVLDPRIRYGRSST